MKGLVKRAVPAPLWERLRLLRRSLKTGSRGRREARAAARTQDRLLAADPGLRAVEADGLPLVGRVVDAFTGADAAEAHLVDVVGAAEAAGVGYFLVRGKSHLRHVVGLRSADRAAFLAEMRRRFGSSEYYVGRPEGGVSNEFAAGPFPFAGDLPGRVANAKVLRFGRLLLGPQGQLLSGLELGCDVEFWDEADALGNDPKFLARQEKLKVRIPPAMFAGAWVAPRANEVADVLPAEARVPAHRVVGERKFDTFEPFDRKLVDEVDFPVDAVYMWVDGDDPVWAAKRAGYLGEGVSKIASAASNFVSRDELKYSLRSLHAFAPYIRNVYIVTAGQTPHWLDPEAEGVRIVDHSEIFADPSVLPVFNSQAIEAQLHRIPGLSDRYLVLNDDTFFRRPSTPSNFFHANGIIRLPFSPAQIGLGRPQAEEAAPSSAGKNVRALLAADFDRFIASKFKHVPHPQIRTLAEELEERYADEVRTTTASRFRAPDNINFATALHHHYALFTGKAVPGAFRLQYIDVTAPTAPERLAELEADRSTDTFCLNDVDTNEANAARIDALVRGFLERMFPFPSPWEKQA
ncbi:stealth family protein [Glycomyces sp. NPDC047369]